MTNDTDEVIMEGTQTFDNYYKVMFLVHCNSVITLELELWHENLRHIHFKNCTDWSGMRLFKGLLSLQGLFLKCVAAIWKANVTEKSTRRWLMFKLRHLLNLYTLTYLALCKQKALMGKLCSCCWILCPKCSIFIYALVIFLNRLVNKIIYELH